MSATSVVAELTKIDALPGAKVELSVSDGDVDAHTGNDALGVSGHIVRAFKNMSIVQHIFRHEPIVESPHVTPRVRVPVLAYAQRATRMLHKEIEQSRLWQLRQVSEHFIRYQMEATGLRL